VRSRTLISFGAPEPKVYEVFAALLAKEGLDLARRANLGSPT
jgi:hypothetical protein